MSPTEAECREATALGWGRGAWGETASWEKGFHFGVMEMDTVDKRVQH